MAISVNITDHIAEVVMDNPPVNALTVAGWFELAELITEAGRDPEVGAVVLRAEGKGFNAGVDIKEMQNTEGFDALLGANRGCYAAFAAVYDCEVPVIAAVHDFCLGGGIGLVGNADVIVAAEGTSFGLPEVNQGALGAATHLARLVPQHKMREMVYTAEPVDVSLLAAWGSVSRVVPRDELRDAAFEIAAKICTKSRFVIRRAKESLNGIDPVDVKRELPLRAGLHLRAQPVGRVRRGPRRLRREAGRRLLEVSRPGLSGWPTWAARRPVGQGAAVVVEAPPPHFVVAACSSFPDEAWNSSLSKAVDFVNDSAE